MQLKQVFIWFRTSPKAVECKIVLCTDWAWFSAKFGYSLWTKESGDIFVALLVYVDNIVITGNDKKKSIDAFKLSLKKKNGVCLT